MNFEFTHGELYDVDVDTLVVFTVSYSKLSNKRLIELDQVTNGSLKLLLSSKEFTGNAGQTAVLYKPEGVRASRVLLIGLGEKKKINHDSFRKAAGISSRHSAVTKVKSLGFYFDGFSSPEFFQAAAEGFLLGGFKMLDYKTTSEAKKKSAVSSCTFAVTGKMDLKKLEKAVARGRIIAEGQLLARRLSYTPANDLTPTILARHAEKLAKENRLKCTILGKPEIIKERMGALLSVSQGSAEPPRFIILEYKGGAAKKAPIVLVGKGVTFDSGGISIKPSLNMHEMKQDMTGAAVMLSTIVTAARLKLPLNIVTLIPSTENMPSGMATKPGDIIKTRKGLTVEIINTDAEGRLILADALDYATKFNPEAVIDIATLTGAALYILGYAGVPIVCNNRKLANGLRKAADLSAERVWELPMWDDFREAMKSPIADLWNSGGRAAATLTAAAFLENFIGNHPWAHIDIAYLDAEPKGSEYTPKGPTGFGTRLLVEMLSNWRSN